MKILIFAFVFVLLLATASLAAGLDITDIKAIAEYDKAYTYSLEYKNVVHVAAVPVVNNSKINVDIFPGSNVTLTIRVQDSLRDVDLNNIQVKVKIKKADDGSDIDEHSADFNLEAENDALADVKINIPFYADAGTYDTLIEARGIDSNKTLYTKSINLKLQIKRLSHDIRITDVLIIPDSIFCTRDVKLTAEVINLGHNSESNMTLEFQSTPLGINSYDKDISLVFSKDISSEDKKYTKVLDYEIPAFIKSGTYPIYINFYWKNYILFDKKTVYLAINDCNRSKTKTPVQEKSPNETEPVTLIMPGESTLVQNKDSVPAATEASVFQNPLVLAVFLGIFAMALLAILIVFGLLRRKR